MARTRRRHRKAGRRRRRLWMTRAVKHRGALHRMLGVPAGKRIPYRLLQKASRAAGILGKRARYALVARRSRHHTRRQIAAARRNIRKAMAARWRGRR